MKKLIFLPLLFLLSGCRVYELTEGIGPDARHIRITAFLTDTKIGKLDASDSHGNNLTLENYDAHEKAMEVISKLVDKVPVVP
jgi:hypothetical protein